MKSKLFIQLLAIVLMVAMLLPTLASCVTITEPEETTDTEVETTTQKTVESTTPKPQDPTPPPVPQKPTNLEGVKDEKTYLNQYFNLSLQLPAHWYFESDSEIASTPLTCFSDRTAAQKKATEFMVACRAVNDATADAIEITIEKKKEGVSDPWYSISEYFKNKPKGWESTKTNTSRPTIGNREYNSAEYIVFENGEGINRVTYYYAMVGDYIICITMITDGFFTEDTHKNHANSRMLDWFGKADTPSTDINAEGGGYYLNDIMAPSTESTIYYNRYCRDEAFHIAGETYYDGFSMNNGNSYGDGRITDAVFKFDGKTYSELTFTVGVRDEDIDAVTTPETNAALQILVDGKQVWEEEFYAFEKAKTYTLDITGAKKVVFRMDDDWELTGLCVADVIVSEQPRNINTSIKPVEGTVDFLVGAIPYYTSASAKILDGSTSVNVAGKDYNKGMVLYNTWQYDSNTYFNLGGKYEQFNFSVGVIKDTLYANGGWLNIYLDGVKILDVELDYDHPKQDYSLDVSGGHILCIQGTAGIDYGFHQGDYALYNMTLGAPVVETPEKVEPGSYKLLSEIDTPFSSKSVKVFDGSSKTHGAYMGDIFYNEGILLKSIYSFLGSPLDSALPAKANFYIGGNYKYLTFTAGRVDKSHVKNDVLVVLGDGVELARYNLAATDFPKSYEVNVEGVDVLQFQLLGDAMLLRGIYMVADIALHTHEIGEVDFYKPEQAPFPDTVDLMERFKPYEYMSAEGNGHDEIRFFNGIYDGSDSKKFFTIDGKNHTRGFVLSTHVYLSLDAGGLIGAGSFGIAGFVGGALALMALAASSEVSQASFACFNLQNQYKTMTFNVGVVDGQNENDKRAQPYDTLYVFADDKIVGEYKLTGDMSTMEITVDVANCERLTFWLDHNRDSYSYGIFDATLTK